MILLHGKSVKQCKDPACSAIKQVQGKFVFGFKILILRRIWTAQQRCKAITPIALHKLPYSLPYTFKQGNGLPWRILFPVFLLGKSARKRGLFGQSPVRQGIFLHGELQFIWGIVGIIAPVA